MSRAAQRRQKFQEFPPPRVLHKVWANLDFETKIA